MSFDAPLIIQCAGCRRIIADSNSMVAAVEQLDAVVLDSLVGARLCPLTSGEAGSNGLAGGGGGGGGGGGSGGGSYAPLVCCGCERELGRRYSEAPAALPAELRHEPGRPRYVIHRSAVSSYQLGGAKLAHDADDFGSRQPPSPSEVADSARLERERSASGDAGSFMSSTNGMATAEDLGGATKQQLVHIMKVILSIDMRIKRLEEQAQQPPAAPPQHLALQGGGRMQPPATAANGVGGAAGGDGGGGSRKRAR